MWRARTSLDHLTEPFVRGVAVLAGVAAATLVLIGWLTGDFSLAMSGWPGAAISAFALGQSLRGRPDIRILLASAVAVLFIAAITAPNQYLVAPLIVALTATGTALSLYMAGDPVWYIGAHALTMTGVALVRTPDRSVGAALAISSAFVFVFTSLLIRALLQQTENHVERTLSLFENAPVAMWEQDFTDVARFLSEIRAQGVTDFEAWLRAHPEATLRIAGLIRITAANRAAIELMEADSEDQLLGQLINRDIDALDALMDQLLAVWRGVPRTTTEMPNAKTRLGHRVHQLVSWHTPIVAGRPDYEHVVVAAVDVTESRATRAALEALLQSKDELVATVSHELRTPLTAVVGLATELSESIDSFENRELRELVSLIASEGREVSTIVEDLLVAAQAETGKLRLKPARVDLVEIATDVHRTLPNAETVGLFMPDQPVWVTADPVRTRQIVRNLVVNAGRYGGDAIRICVAASATTATIEVRDTGLPLPFREREAIFGRFYRARQVPGLTASVGLGLTVSRQLARDMGGDLTYSHDGEEAIFELALPGYIAEAQDLAARQEAAG